ncbi:MAG: lipoyl(octanoyl) transferase LipB [Burkholderiales bacterium]|nr:lipoyl(octanoyl) transferase LipB [Burkholderiales bacterium]
MSAAAAGALVRVLGRTHFEATWRSMQAFTGARDGATRDEIWLTEHPPVYTVGLAGKAEHYPRVESAIPVVRTDRGGQITYHGPGQVVAYTLVDLRRPRWGVRDYVRRLESAMIELLGAHGVEAYGKVDAPGVYVRTGETEAKIGALGLKVRNACTYHGVALNVDMDLAPFAAINPCGYPGLRVTQTRDLGIAANAAELGVALGEYLRRMLDRPT